jgi:hypothetical protein
MVKITFIVLFVLLVAVLALSAFLAKQEAFEDTPTGGSGSCMEGCQVGDTCLTQVIDGLPANQCETPDANVDEESCNKCPQCTWCKSQGKCMAKSFFPLTCPENSGPSAASRATRPAASSAGGAAGGGAAAEASPAAAEKATRSGLLRDIQQVVHNELASFKGMTTASSQPMFQTASPDKVLLSDDPSLQQGTELKAARPTYCPKDMSQYIRKDQIPCWGCTLDY